MMTNLQSWAITTHEVYLALCDAGFSEEQALTLVSAMLANVGKGNDDQRGAS